MELAEAVAQAPPGMYRRAIALAAALLAGVALVGVAPDALSGQLLASLHGALLAFARYTCSTPFT